MTSKQDDDDDDDAYDVATQRINTSPMPLNKSKTISKVPSFRSQHKVVPNTPDWSLVKNISNSAIKEATSAMEQRPHPTRSMFSITSDEDDDNDDDLDFDLAIPKPIIDRRAKKDPISDDENSADSKPTKHESSHNTSKRNAVTKKDPSCDMKPAVVIRAMKIARRCSVSLTRVSLDTRVGNNDVAPSRPNSSTDKKNGIVVNDVKGTASSRNAKRLASKPIESTNTKRTANNVQIKTTTEKSVDQPRRLRDRHPSKGDSKSRKRSADHSENDISPSKAKRSRDKRDKTEKEAIPMAALPKRTSARIKSRAESIDERPASVCILHICTLYSI